MGCWDLDRKLLILRKEDALGSSISLRSMVECRGSGRGVSLFTSHLGAFVVVVWFVLVVGFCVFCWFCFVGLDAPGSFARHLPEANRASFIESQKYG